MNTPLHLFDAYGIEIEYMIVDRDTCRVCPVAELLLKNEAGEVEPEAEHGALDWSNELVQHVIELKTAEPAPTLRGLAPVFQEQVREINRILAASNCMLLPGATHPFMDPALETQIWAHEYTEVYRTFDRIFNCHGHGWSNLQSMHINLPFEGDEEFFRLHGAIRLVLPFIPGLSASSPIQDGRDTGLADSRMDHYGRNCARVPAVTGLIVPEPVMSQAEYKEKILNRIYLDLAPFDSGGILRNEWANARGAIARFTRGAIEIRVIDSQECPAADLAIAELVCAVVKKFASGEKQNLEQANQLPTELLHDQLRQCIVLAENAPIIDETLRAILDIPATVKTTGQLWRYWADATPDLSADSRNCLATIFQHGTLATRMRRGCTEVDPKTLHQICRKLAQCLEEGVMFIP
jgi:gamma-glutamyl:cysteine ligase YbdK (ATP-grasp superfamily)